MSFSTDISTDPPLTNLNSANQTRRWGCAENHLYSVRSENFFKTLSISSRWSLDPPASPRDPDLTTGGGIQTFDADSPSPNCPSKNNNPALSNLRGSRDQVSRWSNTRQCEAMRLSNALGWEDWLHFQGLGYLVPATGEKVLCQTSHIREVGKEAKVRDFRPSLPLSPWCHFSPVKRRPGYNTLPAAGQTVGGTGVSPCQVVMLGL